MAVADVTVKPGIMSAVHVAHRAGSVRIEMTEAAGKPVKWAFVTGGETYVPATDKAAAELVMKPGTYRVTAETGGETAEQTFDLVQGQSLDILLRVKQ